MNSKTQLALAAPSHAANTVRRRATCSLRSPSLDMHARKEPGMNVRAHLGEPLEFEEYVRRRHDALLRTARRLVHDPLDAQDLLQTALARTYDRWDGIADKQLADAYLRRVMINTRTEWWRARKLEELPTEQLPDTSVEDFTAQHADRAMLMDVMKVLTPKQRIVILLRLWEQMSIEETAVALGVSAGTVKSTLHRTLARLREELERRDLAPASASGP